MKELYESFVRITTIVKKFCCRAMRNNNRERVYKEKARYDLS